VVLTGEQRRFLIRRASAALRSGDPAKHRTPATTVAILVGLVLAIAGVIADRAQHPTRARFDRHAILLDRRSGAEYVMLADGRWHRALNHASAELATGGGALVLIDAGQVVPAAGSVGIPNAPSYLPAASELATSAQAWRLCSGPTTNLSLSVGGDRGRSADETVLVADAPQDVYAIFGGQSHRLGTGLSAALGFLSTPIPVAPGLLAAIPTGRPIRPPSWAGGGALLVGTQRLAAGRLVDDIDDGTSYVVTGTGLAAVTPLEAAVLSLGGDPVAARHVQIAPLMLPGGSPELDRQFAGLPPDLPVPSPAADLVCADFAPGNSVPAVRVFAGKVQNPPGAFIGCAGALITTPSDSHVELVTAEGVFGLSNPAAQTALGLGAVVPLLMPAVLFAGLKHGPDLDVNDSRHLWTDSKLSTS
jgi:hypothetical protein